MKNNSNLDTARLAKNSVILYARMLLTMAIGLYTSRVILRELGVVDYGLYNVLGGVVSLFGFIQGSLRNASWRYITVSLGKGDFFNLQKTYSTAIYVHLIFSLLLILISETVGLWFFYNKMVIPETRINEAFWVYQISILTAVFSVMSSPSNSLILAHEKMSAFAYLSIYESIAKLFIVFLLVLFPHDKLLFYSILICIVQGSVRVSYFLYCRYNFKESKLIRLFDINLIREMSIFSGFTILPGLGIAGCGQGLNLLLNIFFGPSVNAARGISVQVQHLVVSFINSFQQAFSPQITKLYASNQLDKMHKLVSKTAKFSFYLFFIPSMLIIFNIDYILKLWLDNVPDDTSSFCIYTLLISMTETISYPFLVGAAANGKIKKYYTINGILLIMVVPIAYIFLKLGFSPISVYISHFAFSILVMYSRVRLGADLINYKIKKIPSEIITPVLAVSTISALCGFFLKHLFNVNDFWDFVMYMMLYGILLLAIVLIVGMKKDERQFVIKSAISILKKFKN